MPRRERRGHGEGSIYRRSADGRFCATVHLGHDGRGKRVRKVFYGKTQQEVLRKRAQFLRDVEEGLVSSKPGKGRKSYTVGEWLNYWLSAVVEPEREPTTYESYEVAVRRHIAPYIGGLPLKELEVEDLEKWLKELKRRQVGLRTRQSALSRLRTALNFGLQRRQQTGLRYNPAALVTMPAGRRPKIAPPNLTHARALLDAARGDRLEAIVTVGLALGLRRGEVIGVKWEDVDLDARILRVRRHVSRVRRQLLVREGTKMDPEREDAVALPEATVQALKAHRGRQLAERLRAGSRWKGPEPTVDGKPAGFVFTSEVGTVLEPRNVYRTFEAMRRNAGLDTKTFHQLRHDCASLLLAQGVPLWAVSQIMRHSSPAITARFYAHIAPELQREAADQMDKVLGPLLSG